MPDDKTKRKPQDSSRVNINEDYEVAYWTNYFHCTAAELKKAVQKVGTYVSDIAKYFKNKGSR